MRLLSSLQLLVLLVLSFFALLATCHPRSTAGSLSNTPDLIKAGHDFESVSGKKFESVDRTTKPGLRQRDLDVVGFREFLDIGRGWNMYYSAWPSLILPVQPAAWALTNLYATMLVQARGQWTRIPPRNSLTLTYGGISIVMHCPQQPIPWLFVSNFAEKLLHITDGGWTGIYELMLSQAEMDVSIAVYLTVVT